MARRGRIVFDKPAFRFSPRMKLIEQEFQKLPVTDRTAAVFKFGCELLGVPEEKARERWGAVIAVLEANDFKNRGRRRG